MQYILFLSSFRLLSCITWPWPAFLAFTVPVCADCSGILCWPCWRSALKSSLATPSTLFSATSTEMRRTVWTGTVTTSHCWEKIPSLPHSASVLLGPLRWGRNLPLWVFVSHWESLIATYMFIVFPESTACKVLWNKCRNQEISRIDCDILRMGMGPL